MVKQRLVDAMDNTIDGYMAFLGQKETESKQYFEQANRSMDDFGKAIADLK